jgi:hypothetical protein
MVLATLLTHVHRLCLPFVWRCGVRICAGDVTGTLSGRILREMHSCHPHQYKTFQFGDIVVCPSCRHKKHDVDCSFQANLLGASLGLEIARRLEYNYRQRREVGHIFLLFEALADEHM